MVSLYRRRFEHYGHGTADQAIVGLGGQVFMRKNSQDAVREFRPYFDNAPVYGHGPSLEDFSAQTPLTVGSPQEVIEKTLGFRDYVGDYQRQLFLLDHAGLPLKTVLEQLDLLGEEVVPGAAQGVRGPQARRTCPTPRPTRRVAAARRRRRLGMTRLVVVSAGLAVPSSTRLLADRLAAAAVEALGEVEVEVIELRTLAHQLTDHLLTGFASGELAEAIESVRACRRAGRGDPGVLRELLGALQDVLRRAGRGDRSTASRC